VVGAAILASLWFVLTSTVSVPHGGSAGAITFKVGSPEEIYARNLRIENIALTRAENFVHQEVTSLHAEITNAGAQPVSGLTLVVEFSDDMKQIVLRESRPLLGNQTAILGPGEKRAFEISFDNVPASWNMQQPALRISQLHFATEK
jgi:hypothetical protein